MTEAFRLIADYAVVYITIVLGIWILVYGSRRWRKYPGGRAIMYFVVSLEALSLLAYTGVWFPMWQGDTREFVRVVVYIFIAYTTTRLLIVLVRRWKEVVEAVGSISVEQATDREDAQEQREAAE